MAAPNVTMVGWVDPPRQRGTYNIIISCLAVLFLCSYKCIHMNVPSPEERDAGWRKIKINETLQVPYWPENALWRKLIRKAKWVLVIIIAPEIGVGLAAAQRADAELQLRQNLDPSWESSLTMSHAFYATMGGIVDRNRKPIKLADYVRCLKRDGFQPDRIDKRPPYFISEAGIANLSKSDTLTKVLAIGQSLYLAVQCIARRHVGLAYSLLELSTALYIICAAAMYWLWHEKPYDAQHVIVIDEEISSYEERIENLGDDHLRSIVNAAVAIFPALLQYGTAILFGGLHLLAWNWKFPDPKSSLCLWLWRGSSLGMAGLPLAMLLFAVVFDYLVRLHGLRRSRRLVEGIFVTLLIATVSLYAVCRLLIIGLVVYSLFHMPSGVYDVVPWTVYFPFIS